MAIRSRVLARHGLVVSQALGTLSLADLRQHRASMNANPDVDRSFGLLFDLRRITGLELNADDIRDHAGFGNSGVARFGRIAILTSNDLTFGMARLFQAYASHRYDDKALRVFRVPAQAWDWTRGLDLGPD